MSDELLRDTHFLGNVFESLVIKELLVYYSKDDAQLFHYRDNSDLEVDIIVKKPNGKYGAIEIKLSKNFTQEAINSLVRFKRKMKSDGQLEPEFLAVIVGVGEISRKTIEGVYILPIDHIG
jgi:predicted AAA+ superfamily ATPase